MQLYLSNDSSKGEEMKVLFYNCRVMGGGSQILVEDGIIKEVGEDIPVPEKTKKFNLNGCFVMPAMIDAHMHFWEYSASLDFVDLHSCRSLEEALEKIKEAPPGVVIAFGWDEGRMGKPLYREDLDKTGRAVVAFRACMHVASLSSEAIRSLCSDEFPERLVDLNKGIFKEKGMECFMKKLRSEMVKKFKKNAKRASEELRSKGLGVVTDMGISEEIAMAYLDVEEDLRIDVMAYLLPEAADLGIEFEKVKIGGVKLYADGSLGGRTAALFEDYSDDPGNRGILIMGPEDLRKVAERYSKEGFQIAIHAIGDRGVWAAVKALKGLPNGPHRIEHCQVIREEEIREMSKEGIIASVQPIFINTDHRWAERRLGERISRAYLIKTLISSGVKLAFGTDAPIEDPNPFYNVYAAVERKGIDGEPEGGFKPEEGIDVMKALEIYTSGNAEAMKLERRGKLAPGFLADLVILPKDPREYDDFRKAFPLMTFSHEDFRNA